ncbi:Dabb family protein [bacterium]|nr:Dabb family protein [bacterium]
MIRHIVALRFRTGTTEATKAALYADLAGLSAQIDGILDFRSFANVSVELALVRGFRDVFWFDLRDAGVRDAYLVHPAHQAVGARIVAELEGGAEGVFVFDVDLA